jgi:microcompartment protein CcmL/EutN
VGYLFRIRNAALTLFLPRTIGAKLAIATLTIKCIDEIDLGVAIVPAAVGVIETLGFPAVLAAADAMVKAGEVTLVYFGIAERGEFLVAVRGKVAEVNVAVAAGIAATEEVYGAQVIAHYIIPNPTENVETVLPIQYTRKVEQFRTF